MADKKLKILRVIENDKRKPLGDDIPEPLPQKSFRMGLIGYSGSGKTVVLNNLLLRFLKDKFDAIYIISPTICNDDSTRFLLDYAGKDNCYETYDDRIITHIIDVQKMADEFGEMGHVCLVIDDFITEVPQNAKIWGLFTKARHYNISIIIASQMWRKIPALARTQLTHIGYFRTANELELQKFIEEVVSNFTGSIDKSLELYMKATAQPYHFLYLDMNNFKMYKNLGDEMLFSKFNDDGSYNSEYTLPTLKKKSGKYIKPKDGL